MNKWDDLVNEPLSKEHKNNVFAAVEKELKANAERAGSKKSIWFWLTGSLVATSCALIVFIFFPSTEKIPADNISEIMVISSADYEMLGDLELLEELEFLEELNDEELNI